MTMATQSTTATAMTDGERDDATPIVRVRGLANRFGTQVVHEGLDLDVLPGEILGVVGGSGTGKSVLMRSIIDLKKPDAGEMRVFGESTVNRRRSERIHGRRDR